MAKQKPPNPNRSRATAAVSAERRARAWDLYKAGWSHSQIAPEIGVSRVMIGKYIRKVLDTLADSSLKTAERYRTVQLVRIQAAMKAIWVKVGQGRIDAIHTMLRLMEREAKLLGLDAPAKVDIEHRIREMAHEEGLDPDAAVREAQRHLKRPV